jgi:hypothetical protein
MLTGLQNSETFPPNIATAVNAAFASQSARCCITALPGAYTGTLTGVLTASANGAIAAQNGVTPAAGDLVLLLEGATHIAANADAGLFQVTQPGTSGTPYILTRPAGWAHGAVIPVGSGVQIGGEDTLFGGAFFTAFCAKGSVVDTTDPALYPDKVTQTVTLASGTHAALTNVPIRPTTVGPAAGGQIILALNPTYGVQPASTTTCYCIAAAGPTPGYIGTASTGAIGAYATQQASGGVVGSDASHVSVTIIN